MSHWERTSKSSERFTPPHVFEALACEFDMDVAAPKHFQTFAPAKRFISENSLDAEWEGFIWMNPPFGGRNDISRWLDKFMAHGNGIALTPDRTSAPWFQKAWAKADAVLFTPKLKFLRPDGTVGKSPSNGTALWAVGRRGQHALLQAYGAGLGVLGAPVLTSRRKD